MKDAFEYKGYWWLPDAEGNKLPGTLSFSQEDGAHLEIVGVFGTEQNKRIEEPTIILGMIQQGKPITLFKCLYSNWTYPLVGLGGARYRAHVIFEGVNFDSEEKIKFHQVCGNYADLDAWVDIYGFSIERENNEGKATSRITYEKPASQFFDIDDDYEVGIGFSSHGPNQAIVQTEVKISQRAYLVVKTKKGDVGFDDLYSRLNIFSDLLLVAIQRIPHPNRIFGFSQENIQEREGREPYYPEINIYYQPVEPTLRPPDKLPNEMMFIFKDLEKDQIAAWFSSFEQYQTVIHLYRTLFYSNRLFIDTKFLNIAQALESLHSILFGNEYLSHDEFVEKRDRVLQFVPDDLAEWVGTALNSANYKRFRLKIFELLKNKEGIIGECIDDLDLFSKRVRDTRNEFVHHNKQKWTFQYGIELITAIDLMTMLFETYLLEILGFSEEKVQELMKPKIQTQRTGWKHLRSIKS